MPKFQWNIVSVEDYKITLLLGNIGSDNDRIVTPVVSLVLNRRGV